MALFDKEYKKATVLPAASLQKLYNCPNSHQPADQRYQPEYRQQQAVVGAVPDARTVIPVQRIPVANPQRGLPATVSLDSPTYLAPLAHCQRFLAAVALERHTHPQGRSESGAGAALTGVIL